MAYDYMQGFAAMGDPNQDPNQKPNQDPQMLAALGQPQPQGGGFDYMGQARYVQNPQQAGQPAMAQGLDGAQAAGNPQNYTAQGFQDWYQGEFGRAIDPTLLGNIGTAVGAAGEGGVYSQDQWNQGQALARQNNQNGQPFFPEFQAPVYEAGPAYQAPGAFQAPTMEQAQSDPGYQFAVKQGLGALQSAQAARGLARTGGSLKALMDYGQQAAAQQYDKVYDRAAQNYARDYQIGRDAWRDNESQRQGAYDRNYRGASDAFNARFRGKELTFEDLYRRWALQTNIQAQRELAD